MQSRTRVTMQDVAREAGVSQSTVSFVLNANTDVRIGEATRAKVIEAARRLGYKPRAGTGAALGQPRPFIGFMVDEIATSIFAAVSIEGAQEAAWGAGYVLDVAMTGGDRVYEETVLRRWRDEGASGIIYASILTRQVTPPPLLEGARAVLLNCYSEAALPAVVPSEVLGGRAATEALIAAGRKRIAFIGGEAWMEAAMDRQEGYMAALASHNRPFEPELVVEGNFLPSGGYEGAARLMDLANPPDAIFCANDLTAVGAYQALAERGVRVPRDVAVMGYDDQEIARQLTPPLSTVLLPHRDMGQWAVDMLLTQGGKGRLQPGVTRLHCPVVMRQSV